jgi:hypothetical protein
MPSFRALCLVILSVSPSLLFGLIGAALAADQEVPTSPPAPTSPPYEGGSMKDLLAKAAAYHKEAVTKSYAHYASAEYHRHWHTTLGLIATIVSTIVATALFTTLIGQIEPAMSQPPVTRHWSKSIGISLVILLAVGAPVLAGMHTFLKYGEQAEQHRVSAAGYDQLRRRLDVFLIRYTDAPDTARPYAFPDFEAISAEFGRLSSISITLTDEAYDKANKALDKLRK